MHWEHKFVSSRLRKKIIFFTKNTVNIYVQLYTCVMYWYTRDMNYRDRTFTANSFTE